jgi:hypothetical protein
VIAVIPAEQNGGMAADVEDRYFVWVFLVERGVEAGSELNLYWRELAATAAARRYVEEVWPKAGALPTDVQAAIERYNQLPAVAEHVLLAPFPIEGHQFFDGDQDRRPRCTVCSQPVVLADADDSQSWIYAADANDQADHTAEVDSTDGGPMEGDIA